MCAEENRFMNPPENFSDGERVMLTKEGAKAHRKHQQTLIIGGGAAALAVALPAALPGGIAGAIGIVSAGSGIGVGVGAQAVVGAAAGAGVGKAFESLFNYPEASEIGCIIKRKERRLGRSGFDYLVQWEDSDKKSWHLGKHLRKLVS
jgi:hypothetical protein